VLPAQAEQLPCGACPTTWPGWVELQALVRAACNGNRSVHGRAPDHRQRPGGQRRTPGKRIGRGGGKGAGVAEPRTGRRRPCCPNSSSTGTRECGASPATAAVGCWPDSTSSMRSRCCGDGAISTVKESAGACVQLASTAWGQLFKQRSTRMPAIVDCLRSLTWHDWYRPDDLPCVLPFGTSITASPWPQRQHRSASP